MWLTFHCVEKICSSSSCKVVSFLFSLTLYPQKYSQWPWVGFEKKNCSKVWHIFLEAKLYDDSKMVCWKILHLGIPELTLPNGSKISYRWISRWWNIKKYFFDLTIFFLVKNICILTTLWPQKSFPKGLLNPLKKF